MTRSGLWRWVFLFMVAVTAGAVLAQSLNESAFTSQTLTGRPRRPGRGATRSERVPVRVGPTVSITEKVPRRT